MTTFGSVIRTSVEPGTHTTPIPGGDVSTQDVPKVEDALFDEMDSVIGGTEEDITEAVNEADDTPPKETAGQKLLKIRESLANRVNDGKKKLADAQLKTKKQFEQAQNSEVRKGMSARIGDGLDKYKQISEGRKQTTAFINKTTDELLQNARSYTAQEIDIDKLFMDEQTKNRLLGAIKDVCGPHGLPTQSDLYGKYKKLLDILKNPILYTHSDLLKALANCSYLDNTAAGEVVRKVNDRAHHGDARTYRAALREYGIKPGDHRTQVLASTLAEGRDQAVEFVQMLKETNQKPERVLTTPIAVEDAFTDEVFEDDETTRALDVAKVASVQDHEFLFEELNAAIPEPTEESSFKMDENMAKATVEVASTEIDESLLPKSRRTSTFKEKSEKAFDVASRGMSISSGLSSIAKVLF
jgi:hypothetical protein